MSSRRDIALGGLGVLLLLTGCPKSSSPPPLEVFAAASLREAFTEVARDFEASHPGHPVRLSFGGSQELRVRIEHGAHADVFASAHRAHLAALQASGEAGPATPFAGTTLVVVTPPGDERVTGLSTLPLAPRVVLGDTASPIGHWTAALLASTDGDLAARIEARVVSRELNVRQVLAKVTLGEADAALVYRTDALAAKGAVRLVSLPEAPLLKGEWTAAVLRATTQRPLAEAFVAHLVSAPGRAVLQRHGFDLEPQP